MARSKYSVLAVDGGGIRGVIPARIIQELERRLNRPASQLFDLVAGTSTGGIIALGLTKPNPGGGGPAFSAAELLSLYVDHGRELFPRSFLTDIRALVDERYDTRPLEWLLQARFGETMLSEALVEVVIPSYDLSRPGPFFFKRRYTLRDRNADVKMWVAARATSAAPTYFEPARLPALGAGDRDHALVDGGVYANNPAVAAYADAIDLWTDEAEIHVVSIGTGAPPTTNPGHGGIPIDFNRAQHWGLDRWARPMLEVVLDGVAKAVEWQMDHLCNIQNNLRYHRLQAPLATASHAMDDASPENIQRLQADAEALLADSAQQVDKICAMLDDVSADRDRLSPAAAVPSIAGSETE